VSGERSLNGEPTPVTAELTVDSMLREAARTRAPGDGAGFVGTDRFEVVRWLGRGGFGVVYQALDRHQRGMVALKVLRRPQAELVYRFKREFRALAEVRHENLVRLYELEADGRDVFFTMELVDGEPLLADSTRHPEKARDVLRQLVEGLAALHRAGKLHRDVKPSNILVEKGGRVVLLDFGLAVELDAGEGDDRAGTPHYMSPEQCAAQRLTEASDWYAVGVVLFEALTGRRPFEGSAAEVQAAKQARESPRASSLVAEIPADLDELCAQLLARDPAKRPSGAELLALLSAAPIPERASEPFVGRAAELSLLWRIFEQGRGAMVLARGPSGIGKSALLRRFLEDLAQRRPQTRILAGRCYERESVPYKALDAVVDELARQLVRMPDAASLLPQGSAALCQLFPVLRRVPAFAAIPRDEGDIDGATVRNRGLAALRELFARLAARGPVVVSIDDLQWGDVDSAVLLADLVREPDPPPVFWLASFRQEEIATSPMLRRLTALRESTMSGAEIHDLELGALGTDESRELAAALLIETRGDGTRAAAIASESGGSPFFLQELARARGSEGALGELVQRRVAQLEGDMRRIVEVMAVAARPLELEVLAGAAGVDGDLGAALVNLRSERWIRAREGDSAKLLETYHDRIREAVVSGIAPEPLKAVHLRLAAALERSDSADAARVGRHLADGGDPARAQGYFTRAAEQASAALAFDEAARLYQSALDLSRELGGDTVSLELARAEALSAAGHGPEAAQLWLGAVERVDKNRRNPLKRRAAEELLLCGRVDEGYAAIDSVLAELGLSLPRSGPAAIAQAAWGRLRQKLSSQHLKKRAKPCSERELERLDTIAGLSWAVGMLDPLVGYALQTQHLRLAFRSGDPARAALALALEAPLAAMKGPKRERSRRTLDEARRLAVGDPRVPEALFSTVEGLTALFEGRWPDGLRHMENAENQPHVGPIGHSPLYGTVASMRMMNLFWMGRSGDLLQAIPSVLRSLEERSNLYGWLWLKLLEAWAHSCAGRLQQAWATSVAVRERLPQRGFQLQRWYLEFGQIKFLLIEQRADEAWQRVEALARQMRFSPTGQAQRASGLWVRATTALGCAQASPKARAPMLAEAQRAARKLEREGTPWILALARAVRASIASVSGDEPEAMRLLAEAEPLLDERHLEAVAAVARLARGRTTGDAALVAKAEAWMASQRVSPLVARVLLPGAWSA
jgi:hypothetical protein